MKNRSYFIVLLIIVLFSGCSLIKEKQLDGYASIRKDIYGIKEYVEFWVTNKSKKPIDLEGANIYAIDSNGAEHYLGWESRQPIVNPGVAMVFKTEAETVRYLERQGKKVVKYIVKFPDGGMWSCKAN